MRQMSFRLLMFVIISAPIGVNAQIIPDNTLLKPSIVNQSGNTQIVTGGTSLTNNLFHSFSQFSIPPNGIAQFQHEPAVKNLLVRVTGSVASNIDGKLETSLINDATKRGEANLFLLNPNGIIFGKDSSLNLGGSFIATAADSISFIDGGKFSVRGSEDGLLTVGVPIGLQFGKNPGSISSFSQLGLQVQNNKTLALIGSNLKLAGSFFSATPGNIELSAVGNDAQIDFNITNLTFDYKNVTSFTDITLTEGSRLQVGNGNIFIRGKNITIKSGSQLISTTTGPLQKKVIVRAEDSLTITGSNMVNKTLQPSGIGSTQRGGSAGANIEVTARNLFLSELGNITTLTNSEGRGGEITIKASGKVDLIGVKNNDELNSGLFANSTNTGKAGSISISETQSISVKDGARILSISNNFGDSGNIILKTTDFITVQGAIPIDKSGDRLIGRPTIVSTQAKGNGNAGTLSIETKRLQVSEGAQVSTSIQGKGNAGKIDINAEEIELSGVGKANDEKFLYLKPKDNLKLENGQETPNRIASSISSDARSNSIGQGADLQIKTDRLTIKDGAVIQSVTFGSGDAGNIFITPKSLLSNSQQFISLQGVAPTADDPFPSSIIAFSGGIPNRNVFSVPEATGKGGNITIDTPNLKLTDGALIALGSLNSTPQAKGAGDRLKINANVISLNRAELNAQTNAGNGGKFDITANGLLILRNGSKIITQAGGINQGGNAGNITIKSPLIIAKKTENSDINANAAKGNGGTIDITADSIVGLEVRPKLTDFSDITASSDRGVQGTITLNGPNIDPDRGTVALPIATSDPSNRIDQSCSADRNVSGQFTIGGQGGLPASPQTFSSITPLSRLVRVALPVDRSTGTQFPNALMTIREARGIRRLTNGKIRFLAEDNGVATRIGLQRHCR